MNKTSITSLALLLLALLCMTAEAYDVPARRVRNGIIVADTGAAVRAIEPFRGNREAAAGYAFAVSSYAHTFPDVRVYCMVIPNAVAYYCPDTAAQWTEQEQPAIADIHRQLADNVRTVDLFPVLQQHVDEPIYSRTDHHWAPLGAFYAAEEFARVAGVPFRPMADYERRVIHDYVGSMSNFSRDRAIREAPEDFVFYVPRDTNYEATRVVYKKVAKRVRHRRRSHTVSYLQEGAPEHFDFFRTYEDGSSAAYCTFMGGDNNTTSVRTNTANGRRVLILKDSYGNALPGYLFGSFEEVHVIDCRYFLRNIGDFVRRHGITDILFANNLIHASMPRTSEAYRQYLRQ